MKRKTELRASMVLGGLALLAAAVLSAGVAGAAPLAGAELEFAGDTAGYAAGQVAVPVECVGGPTGLCSGTLRLSWRGGKSVSGFSVQAGGEDTVFVPLPRAGGGRPAKIAAVATTTQSLGPAVTRKAMLHLH